MHLQEREHLEDPGVDRRKFLKWILKKWDKSTDWVELAQDKDRWGAPVNAVMKLRVS
jgi:hypothetical protein